MADPKNIFNFGTGDIDKDQWLKDIDNGQEEFITKYGSATNKHKTALLRQAFQDLRSRLASGDMLRRNSDGMYEFSSALNRDDKHMQEAYERALGFMGNLARKQINTPKSEPEKKKFDATTLQDEYKKHLFPGEFNEKAYWDRDEAKRKQSLVDFLNGYLKEGALDSYQDFGSFGSSDKLKERISAAVSALQSGQEMDWNLGRLGFQGNWINKPKDEEEKPKSELEQVQADLAQAVDNEKVKQGRQYLGYLEHRGNNDYEFTFPSYDFSKELKTYLQNNKPDMSKPIFGIDPSKAQSLIGNEYVRNQQNNLNQYFNDFGVKWKSLYDSHDINRGLMAKQLAMLFAQYNKGTDEKGNTIKDYAYDWSKFFTQIGTNQFLINGSIDKNTGRYAYYEPGKGIRETSIIDTPNQYVADQLGYSIPSQKQGGKINFLQSGGGFDFEAWERANDPQVQQSPKPAYKKSQDNTNNSSTNQEMDAGDWITILGTTAADIGSMLSANAVGAGTAVSAGLGVASTLGNSVNDFRHGNVGSGLANLGIGLTTDLIGLVPGFGAGAKGYKIGRTLTRFARPLMAAFAANNFKEAGEVLGKGVRNGFGSLTAQDWTVLSAALTSMVSRGKSAHTRQKNVEFINKASQHSSPTDAKGNITKHIINEEGFIKARKELLNQKRFGYNTASKKYTKKLWNSIPEGGEIATPFYAKPFEWPKFSFGKDKKLKQVEEFEDFLKRNKKPEASPQGSGPDAPVAVPNENADGFYPLIKNGAKLKALRSGGIIKGQFGIPGGLGSTNYKKDMQDVDMSLDPNELYYDPREAQSINYGSIYSTPTFIDYNNRIAHGAAGLRGTMGNLKATQGQYMHNGTQDYQSALNAQKNYYTMDNGKNIMGDVLSYYNNVWLKDPNSANKTYADFVKAYNANVDTLRARHYDKFNTGKDVVNQHGWGKFNTLHRQMYGSYGKYLNDKGEVADDWNEGAKDILGESTWRRLPNAFNGKEYDALRRTYLKDGDESSYIYMDNNGHLQLTSKLKDEGLDPYKVTSPEGPASKGGTRSVDKLGERNTILQNNYKNPFDPSNLITAGKLFQAIRGNANIYGNLIKEMPQAPMRDPIHRQLAIVGNQRVIDEARNRVGALRQINRQQRGSDQQANFATTLETERVGRDDIMDKAFDQDASRQFDTAQKLWNLKNDDVLRNNQITYENDKARKDRERMIAQIRAAWRSGDQNAIMGAMADTGNWLMKKYQREQDIVNLAREQQLGTKEQFLENYIRDKHADYDALKAKLTDPKVSDTEKAQIRNTIQQWNLEILREAPAAWSEKIYNTFHTPGFGGGYKTSIIGKDGVKLEVEKLKARGKDNDRYVSMIKDLRKTSYRRRRR